VCRCRTDVTTPILRRTAVLRLSGSSVAIYAGDGRWSYEEDYWDLRGAREPRSATEACARAYLTETKMSRRFWPDGPSWARSTGPSGLLGREEVTPITKPAELRALLALFAAAESDSGVASRRRPSLIVRPFLFRSSARNVYLAVSWYCWHIGAQQTVRTSRSTRGEPPPAQPGRRHPAALLSPGPWPCSSASGPKAPPIGPPTTGGGHASSIRHWALRLLLLQQPVLNISR